MQIINGDALETLKSLPDKYVQCCVTSPPYYGLRDYNVEGQIGLEKTLEDYITKIITVFKEVHRVLKDDGTLWLNLGDSYAASGRGGGGSSLQKNDVGTKVSKLNSRRQPQHGFKSKDLMGVPWRVAFALQHAGWYLRQDIIWSKPNPMPESVTDRCTKSHEYIFLLSKSPKYYFDQESIKEPCKDSTIAKLNQDIDSQTGSDRVPDKTNGKMKAVGGKKFNPSQGGGGTSFRGHSGNLKADGTPICGIMVNKRSVWTVTTQPYTEAHFATFPPKLIRSMILAGCPFGGIILDPFAGSGTTGQVAIEEGRDTILIELNPKYIELINQRIRNAQPPLLTV